MVEDVIFLEDEFSKNIIFFYRDKCMVEDCLSCMV